MSDDDSDSDSDRSVGASRNARLDQLVKVGLSPVDTSGAAFKYERRGFEDSENAATEGARSVPESQPQFDISLPGAQKTQTPEGSQPSFGGCRAQPNSTWDNTPGASRSQGSPGGVPHSTSSLHPQPPIKPPIREHGNGVDELAVPLDADPFDLPGQMTAMKTVADEDDIRNRKNLSELSAMQKSHGGQGGEEAEHLWQMVSGTMARLENLKKQYATGIFSSGDIALKESVMLTFASATS